MRRKLKYILIGILGIFLFISVIYFILAKDEPPPDDSDLRLSKINIPEGENAFFTLNKATEKIYWPKEGEELILDILEEKEWDEEFVKELLEKNKEAFEYFERSFTYPQFQVPGDQNLDFIYQYQDPEAFFLDPQYIFRLNNLVSIKAIFLFSQNKEKEAFDETMKIIKLGQMIEDSPRPRLLTYLIGRGLKESGLKTLKRFNENTTLPPETLKNYIKELEQYKLSREGLKKMLKWEYTILANQIDELNSDKFLREQEKPSFFRKIVLKYFFKPNKEKRRLAESFKIWIENVDKNYSEIRKVEFLPPPPPKIKTFFSEFTYLLDFAYFSIVTTYEKEIQRKYFDEFLANATQLLLAFKAYKIKTGELPRSLENLLPEYLSEIPQDPFDGKPIRYLPEKKIIYSGFLKPADLERSEKEDWQYLKEHILKIEF